MRAQSRLVRIAPELVQEFMGQPERFVGATAVRTHKNKGKVYPYASKRQNTRRQRWHDKEMARLELVA